MGIKGLKYYIEHEHPENGIKENINFKDKILKWKVEHEMNEPVILIDLKGFAFEMLRNDEMNVALGIRFNDFNNRYLKFIKNLRTTGAKLVFFAVGRKQTDDDFLEEMQSTIIKSNSKYNRYMKIMDAIENETEFLSTLKVHDLNWTKHNIKCMSSRLGDFVVTHCLHNCEIAEYLCSESVMAIITNDSDFLAIDGEFEYWSLGDINFATMEDGAIYSKKQLNSKLGLIRQRVHSVDVLVGSVSTPVKLKSELNAHFKKLTNWYDWRLDQNMAEESELMKFCKTKHSIAYKLVTYKIFIMKETFVIDFRMFRNYSYSNMVLPIVMKLCGILSKDEPRPPQTRKIFMKFAHKENPVIRDEEIIYPSMELPLTYELIAIPENNDYDEYRWSLLAWVLNLDRNLISKIRRINQPKNIKVVIISLQYLFQHQEIRSEEAYIVLLTEIQINQKEIQKKNDPKERFGFVIYPEKPNIKYVRMAHLYPKIYVWMNRCLVVCGLSSNTDLIRFDGPLYHSLMEKLDDANETEKDALISEAKAIWIFDNN